MAKRTKTTSVTAKLALGNGERVQENRIANISLGGVFVEMNEPLAFGSQLSVEFNLPGNPRVIRCTGMVIWNTKKTPGKAPGRSGIGVRLADIGIAEMRHLAQSVGQEL